MNSTHTTHELTSYLVKIMIFRMMKYKHNNIISFKKNHKQFTLTHQYIYEISHVCGLFRLLFNYTWRNEEVMKDESKKGRNNIEKYLLFLSFSLTHFLKREKRGQLQFFHTLFFFFIKESILCFNILNNTFSLTEFIQEWYPSTKYSDKLNLGRSEIERLIFVGKI